MTICAGLFLVQDQLPGNQTKENYSSQQTVDLSPSFSYFRKGSLHGQLGIKDRFLHWYLKKWHFLYIYIIFSIFEINWLSLNLRGHCFYRMYYTLTVKLLKILKVSNTFNLKVWISSIFRSDHVCRVTWVLCCSSFSNSYQVIFIYPNFRLTSTF